MLKIGLGLVVIVIAIGGFLFWQRDQVKPTPKEVTWEECTKLPGAVIMESYPAQCSAPDGSHAVQPLSEQEKKGLEPPEGF